MVDVSISTTRIGSVGTRTYALLHEDAELALIFNLDQLLAAVGRVRAVMEKSAINPSCFLFLVRKPQAPRRLQHRCSLVRTGARDTDTIDEYDNGNGNIQTYMFNFILSGSQVKIAGPKE